MFIYSFREDFIFPYYYEDILNILNIQVTLGETLLELLEYYKNSEDKVINKIKTKYNNNKIKEKINLIYNDIIINNILETKKMNNELIKLLEIVIKKDN